MYGDFMLAPLEWKLLYFFPDDGLGQSLPPGIGKTTEQTALAKGYIEQYTKSEGKPWETSYWRMTAKGKAAFDHDTVLRRAPPEHYGRKSRK